MTVVGWILLSIFWLLLAAAAVSDLKSLRISNLLSLATLAAAIAVWLVVRESPGPWWGHLASFAIVLAVGFGLFSIGWFGGGDAKLAAAAAVLFSLGELLWYAVAVTFAGAVLTIVLIALRRLGIGTDSNWKGLAKGRAIPYGVAIALGAGLCSAMLPDLLL